MVRTTQAVVSRRTLTMQRYFYFSISEQKTLFNLEKLKNKEF